MATMPFSPCDSSLSTCPDATVGILTTIFGPVITAITQGADPNSVNATANVLATMFSFFNSGILVVGSLIVAYVAVMGAVNTANDGEAMGKAWSAFATPVRIVAGGAVLLPSTSGYSFIQLFSLMIALWGVGFANGVYNLGMTIGLFNPAGIVASTAQPGTFYGLRDFAKQYLAASYCAKAANAIYTDPAGTPQVTSNPASADSQVTTGTKIDYTFLLKDRNTVTNLGGGAPICGTVTLSGYSVSGSYSDTSGVQAALDQLRAALNAQKLAAATGLMEDIDNWVATMPSDVSQSGFDQINSAQFNTIVQAREAQVVAAITAAMSNAESGVDTAVTAFVTSQTQQGWAMAGGWYQRVGLLRSKLSNITSESIGGVSAPSLSTLPADARASLLTNSVTTVPSTIIQKAELNGKGYEASTTVKPEDMASMLPTSGGGDWNVGAIVNNVGSKMSLWVNGLMQSATNTVIGSTPGVDAISRMKITGDLLASYQLQAWSAAVALETTMTAARVVVGTVGGVEVLGNKADFSPVATALWEWVLNVPVPILTKMATYLGVLGFYLGVILPSMPYTIFMITVVGWVLAVLQTVIAAPLWAIMHMRPSNTFVGSDAQGYLLLLALFVRPALAVIGLFAAFLVANPIVDYITQAFFAMRGDVTASTGMLGALAQFYTFFWWMTAYSMLLLPVLYMIYGLPQVLPDHVLKWINAGVHDLGATHASGQMQSQYAGAAAQVKAETAPKLGGGARRGAGALPGGGGGGGGGGGSGSRSGAGGNTPLNANSQGVTPALSDSGASAGAAAAPKRSLRRMATDGAGVAIGRTITGVGRAVNEARAGTASLGGGLKNAVLSAGAEGVSAFKEGADSRIAGYRAEHAARGGNASPTSAASGAQTALAGGGGVEPSAPNGAGVGSASAAAPSGGSASPPSASAAPDSAAARVATESLAPVAAPSVPGPAEVQD